MDERRSWRALWLAWMTIAVLVAAGCPAEPVDDDQADDDDTTGDDDDDDDATGDDDTTTGDDDISGDDDSTGDDDDDTAPPAVELTIPCADSLDDVYVTPGGMPAWDETVLGDVVRCAPDEVLSVAEVHDRLLDAGIDDVVPFSGASVYRIGYRTTRWEGVEGYGSARIFLPDTQHVDGILPTLIAAHGTIGLADHCAPSLYPTVSEEMILPFVGNGFAVIAPDYAGLGTEGIQGYGDNRDTGHSTPDAGRALAGIVTPGSVAEGAIVIGHSQGGGAVLSAQALSQSYADGLIRGAIAVAPGWSQDNDSLWMASHYPYLTPWAGTPAMVMTLVLYADAANHLGPPYETLYFDPMIAEEVAGAVADQCVIGLTIELPLLAATLGGALSEEFVDTVAACLDGEPACGPPGEAFVQRSQDNVLSGDPGGAEILVLAGLLDESSTPAKVACIVESLEDDGAPLQVCTDAGAEHMDLPARQASFALDWATALAREEPAPPCAESDLPACE